MPQEKTGGIKEPEERDQSSEQLHGSSNRTEVVKGTRGHLPHR